LLLALAVAVLSLAACDSRPLVPGAPAVAGGAADASAGADLRPETPTIPPSVCSAGGGCTADQFCSVPCASAPGDRQAPACESLGTACSMIFDPVCGCDGVTYPNDCLRRAVRVARQSGGNCPFAGSMCAGPGSTCGRSQFCQYPAGACGTSDGSGQCVPVPLSCDADAAPVCGCDGETYDNDCVRQRAGVSVSHVGRC
jgi:hypothetical protein